MRWGKIIPVILFSVLVLSSVSGAWQETVALNTLRIDMPRFSCANVKSDANLLELNGIRIDLEPLVSISHNVEGFVFSQQKTLKSA